MRRPNTSAAAIAILGLLSSLSAAVAQDSPAQRADAPGLLEPTGEAEPVSRRGRSSSISGAGASAGDRSAILIRNPNTRNGEPPFALADEFGRVQRYVEPTVGIDLGPHVGQIVAVEHDTGKTLLASQLRLEINTSPVSKQTPPRPANLGGVTLAAPTTPELDSRPVVITQFEEEAPKPAVSDKLLPEPVTPAPLTPEPIILEEIIGDPIVQPVEGLPLPMAGGVLSTAPAAGPACEPDPLVARQRHEPCPPRVFGYGELLFLRPTGVDVAHAQQQNGVGGAGTVPFGSIGTTGHGFDTGLRLGLGVALSSDAALEASYATFGSGAVDNIIPPDLPGGGGAVGSLVHHPNTDLTASVGPVSARQSIDFELADLLYRGRLTGCGGCVVSYSLGLQYAELEQGFRQTGVFAGGAGGAIDTSAAVDFRGGGFKGGVDGYRRVNSWGAVYGRFAGALMSGEFESAYRQVNTTTDVTLAIATLEQDRIVPQLELELGVAYLPVDKNWSVSLGYQFQHWFNVVSTPVFIDAVQADNYTSLGDTLSLNGFTARAEARW